MLNSDGISGGGESVSSALSDEWDFDRTIMTKGMPGCGNTTIEVWSGGCTAQTRNVGEHIVIAALGARNDGEGRETMRLPRCQIREEVEGRAKDLVLTPEDFREPLKALD